MAAEFSIIGERETSARTEIPMCGAALASRTFGESDQGLFAGLSADFNPLHMDPVAARRTQAGAPVVHGIHAVLWGLDKLVEAGAVTDNIVSLRVQFTKFIYLGSTVDLKVLHRDEKSINAEIALNGVTNTTLVLGLGTRKEAVAAPPVNMLTKAMMNRSANVLRIEEMADLSGWMDLAVPAEEIGRLFPHAASVIGCRRVAAIALLSRLVGRFLRCSRSSTTCSARSRATALTRLTRSGTATWIDFPSQTTRTLAR